ncbi:glycoside hydrolase family 61 protein [Hypoxylon trugodes]|uniref:glycoside hydrolase family 61 protein n=1 Tax=Hypoxylon trugodes TaxID=326681 RepID=UPI002195673E|nr:glycoside hydrolase family 61 protein [Hypoxylon trugodes]KAI1394260.1 glycoside hydrolase family 61 protein [Hypoxylon trugodes]
MKLLTLLALTGAAQAHYHFPRLIINGEPEATDWTSVRMTKNYQSNAGVTSVSSPDMRCYQMRGASNTATVAAGDVLGFVAASAVTHFGPVQFYMAKVPEGADISTWDPAGNVWFKIGSITAVPPLGSSEATWPAYNKKSVNVTIPAAVPSGKYLVRVESIALHQAQSVGGAQIYLSCAQIEVTGGGNGKPGPLVAFPGAYQASDPGLLWSYYPVPTTYTAPGPAVWTG